MPEEDRSTTEGHGDPTFARKDEQPEGSQVDTYAPKYAEPDDASITEPESRSGASVGSAEWECMTCTHQYSEDHGKCPNCGAPLRKTGVVAAPVAEKHREGGPVPMATRPDQTPEGYGDKPATASSEPDEGNLQGERGSGV